MNKPLFRCSDSSSLNMGEDGGTGVGSCCGKKMGEMLLLLLPTESPSQTSLLRQWWGGCVVSRAWKKSHRHG